MLFRIIYFLLFGYIFGGGTPSDKEISQELPTVNYRKISGIYPHLAYYNKEAECGTGAVVSWADRLWVITYGPHKPLGSSDKLYEITPNLEQIIRAESIGGTPANRMIHQESGQLFIGPYAIDQKGEVTAIPYAEMPGRHTGNARHLTDPEDKIYYGTMEEGFYEVNVHTLEVKMLYKDGNNNGRRVELDSKDASSQYANLLGAHGKGLYSGQGVLMYTNNGEPSQEALKQFDIESGVLAEWDGNNWKVVRRNQFVEVTGPGGIYGNSHPETDPIWATGWDHKSVIIGVRSPVEGWGFYRLPKASHSYDGAHGWNTEWPRIRNIGSAGQSDYLMTMHGLFWRFPQEFSHQNTKGIRPRSSYLKVIGDFTRWKEQLVFGCDDSAQKEFLNTRKQKGGIEGPGQSNSNLWFTDIDKPDQLGPNTASGAVWLNEDIKLGVVSEPFLFAGWPIRSAWIQHQSTRPIRFTLEVDKMGNGQWEKLKEVEVLPNTPSFVEFFPTEEGEWVRATSNANAKEVTLSFHYSDEETRGIKPASIFSGLANADQAQAMGGILYGLGEDRKALGVSVAHFDGYSHQSIGYYELDASMNLIAKDDPETDTFIQEKFAIPKDVIQVESSSILVIDDKSRRWRFPLGEDVFSGLTEAAALRMCREVATERDLFNCHGTFYELPAENADGFAKVRPIASHNFRIHDYASYRGLLIMTGLDPNVEENDHIIRSSDGKAAVWAGAIDDLWELGKPTGRGGPWKDTEVSAGQTSDPYLIGFYDDKTLTITHDAEEAVVFTIEVEPLGHGPWMIYEEVSVQPGETFTHQFPDHFHARWIRFSSNKNCKATTWLVYK